VTDAPEPTATFADPARLLDTLQRAARGETAALEAVARATRQTFASADGQLALLAHMNACQVARIAGPALTGDQRHYHAGLADGALMLCQAAGFDPRTATLAAVSNSLRGLPHDRHDHHPGHPDRPTARLPGDDDY
jgi:hypothetical protein